MIASAADSSSAVAEPLEFLSAPALRVVDVATGLVTDPTGGRVPSATFPSWSPTGDRLAFVSRPAEDPDQRLTDLPGGEVYVVTTATGEIASPSAGRIAHPWRVAWSPTQETIVVWTRGPDQAHDAERTPLYLLDVQTGALTDLNPGRALVTMPVWSPDGRSLAYVEHWTRLRVRSLDGDDRSFLLDSPGTEFLSWSPDGAAIVVAGGGQPSLLVWLAGENAGRSTAFTLRYDTSRRQAGPPQWSPLHSVPDPRAPSVGGTARDA
jgi:Tol biopolymer transport system component